MLTDADFARLTDLVQKTEKTPEEEVELAGLKARATAPDADVPAETTEPAKPAGTPLPVGMEEALAQIQALKDLYKAQQAQVNALHEANVEAKKTIDILKAGQDAVASGQVKTLFKHCNNCGRRLRQGEEFCPAHPNEHVNHVGLNPVTGGMMLAKQTKRTS